MEAADLARHVERVTRDLPGPLTPVPRPFLIMLSGLPGAGKSTVARELRRRLGATIVESDAVRWQLFQPPTFSEAESAWVFQVCHMVIERLLSHGVPVIMDATNLIERHREAVYSIVERLGVPVFILRVEAPPAVVRARLAGRAAGADAQGYPFANWEVYQRMRLTREPILRPHRLVDTSQPLGPALDQFAAEVQAAVAAEERIGP